MRLGPLPGQADARLEGRRGLRPGGHLRAPSPPLRGQQPLPPDARGGRHDPVRPVARRPARRDRRAHATTRGSWPASSTRSSSRRPERPHPLFDGFVAAALAVRDGREPVFARPAEPERAPASHEPPSADRHGPSSTASRRAAQLPEAAGASGRTISDRRAPHGASTPMKIFLDTADIEEIRTVARWGVLDGVTTNPTLYAKVGGSYDEILQEVCKITPGPGLGRGRRRRRRRDARGGPPLREARPEHRGQGRDERERPRGDQPLRRGRHQDQLHADLHGQPGPARGQGRGVA